MNLNHALCRFIPEVTKSKGEGPYPGKTLYQMVVAIQKYLNINKINWKLVDSKDPEFCEMHTVLDNVMKERAAQGIGTTKKQAETITYDYENQLWVKGVLGEQNPDQLRNTCLFLISINCLLHASDEHYHLHRDTPECPSQFSFKRNMLGQRCLVYTEDTITKTNDGGLAHMKKERKIVWVHPLSNVDQDPDRLVDKYISLCPDFHRKPNFYLHSLSKYNPVQWYGEQVVSQHSLSKVVKNLLASAAIDGYFTNHSLRRSGATRLFQANVDWKLVKEATGQECSSDAVDTYQVTSDQQRQKLSEVIAGVLSLRQNQKVDTQGINDLVIAMNNVSIQCDEQSFKPDLFVNCGIVELCNCKRQIGDLVNQVLIMTKNKHYHFHYWKSTVLRIEKKERHN